MNTAAIRHYSGGKDLLGTSIFDCHNEDSNKVIREVFEKMLNGLTEELISKEENKKVFMRAVRDEQKTLMGYYERYEYKTDFS